MSSPVVEVVRKETTLLSEGPFYDQLTEELIWADIHRHTINFLHVETGRNRSLTLPDTVGAAIPVEGSKDQLVALVGKEICLVNRDTGALQSLATVDHDKPHHRFNDGKCSPQGVLWAGTMAEGEGFDGQGSLYSYSKGVLRKRVSDVTISNGMDWSPDHSTMYYIDSVPHKVYAFDYSHDGEEDITNQRVLVDYSHDKDWLGAPDGMSLDVDGNLWVAGFLSHTGLTQWSPTGEKLQEIAIPAPASTSCCFGGVNFDLIFVTSCSDFSSTVDWNKYSGPPGAIFVVRNSGACGRPAYRFKL